MFSTFKQKLLLGIYVFILMSIPVGAYLASEYQTLTGSAQEKKSPKPSAKPTPKATASAAKQLLKSSEQAVSQNPIPSPSSSASPESSPVAIAFGPTLVFKVSLEGRPTNNQTTRMFVGITEGNLTTNPKFLLTLMVDVPASGQSNTISLAGLEPGTRYTALLKGSTQIATSSAFTMSPAATNLNDGQPLNLLSGDFNEDNVINSTDYAIAQKAMGAIIDSANWNENTDLNKDGTINTFDLGIVGKNIGQIGASGAWSSPIPIQTATPSASLNSPPVGSPEDGDPIIVERSGGYWIWIPN